MITPFLTALSLVVATSALAPAAPAARAQTGPIRAESERYSVEALDPGDGNRPARVIVSDNVTSRKHMVMVNSTLGALKRAVIREDQQRITLVCGKGFAVTDPAGVANTDEVYGVDAVLSPGGRWIAYRRFFPATHPGPSDGILVYDTKQPREKNHSAYPIAAERDWRAGWAIYPPAREWKDANAVADAGAAYVLTSPLAWEGDSRAPVLLFTMRRDGNETVVLSEVNGDTPHACWSGLPGGAERWRVKTLRYRRSGAAHAVTVASSAVTDAPETTLSFPDTCTGEIPQRTNPEP